MHQLQLHQEPPWPPRIQEETWRIGGVLKSFLLFVLDENFSKASDEYFEDPDTIPRSIKNIHVLQDSRKRLRGYMKSWLFSIYQISMKLSVKLPRDNLCTLTQSPTTSRTSLSSKTPGGNLENRWSFDYFPNVGSWWIFYLSLPGIFWVPWHHPHLHQ